MLSSKKSIKITKYLKKNKIITNKDKIQIMDINSVRMLNSWFDTAHKNINELKYWSVEIIHSVTQTSGQRKQIASSNIFN